MAAALQENTAPFRATPPRLLHVSIGRVFPADGPTGVSPYRAAADRAVNLVLFHLLTPCPRCPSSKDQLHSHTLRTILEQSLWIKLTIIW